jgi:hypothetical protein
MPSAPAYGLQVQTHFNDLVLATYGRGVWILDDVTPLQQLTSDVKSSDIHLFKPRDAYRFQPVEPRDTAPGSQLRAQNPPYGASLHYWLGSEAAGEVNIEIFDTQGNVVRKLEGSKEQGLHRVWWNLRHPDNKDPVLRTDPPGKDWVHVDDETGRKPITWSSGSNQGPKAVPGTYTVKLTVDDTEQTQQLNILKDPHSEGTLEDIREQVALRLRMQEEFNKLVDAVEKAEWIRAQLEDLLRSIEADPAADPVRERAEALQELLIEIEHHFIDIHLTGGREDSFRNPMKLYGRYLELMSELNRTSDFPPTVQQNQVADLLQDRLFEALDGLSQLMQTELAEFNTFLEQQNLSTTIR